MTIQVIINNIFRQDFKNHLVLGRVLFGIAMLFLGLFNLFNISAYANYAPDYLPLPQFFVVVVGLVLTVCGFALFANLHTERAAQAILLLFIAFILIVNLPQSNMLDLSQSVAFIAAALLIAQNAKQENEKDSAKTGS